MTDPSDNLVKRLAFLEEGLQELTKVIETQACDKSLWWIPWNGIQTECEARLQRELRRLHSMIADMFFKSQELSKEKE